MKITPTKLFGVMLLQPDVFHDDRGDFVKTFHQATWDKEKLPFKLKESYYSISKKNVIRGMHFQTPPQDHTKLVYVTAGSILDVVLDIRQGSKTYGDYLQVELSAENHQLIYIPSGLAHGFLSLADNSCVTYLQTSVYSPDHDAGIRFDSFGFNWPSQEPIMSERDKAFPTLDNFKTPFQEAK